MSPWDFGKINLSSTLQRQSLWKFKALPMATEDTRGSRSQAHHSLLVPYNLTHRLFRSFRPRHKAYLLSRLPRKGMGVCMCVCEFHKKLLRTEEPCFLSLPTSLAVPPQECGCPSPVSACCRPSSRHLRAQHNATSCQCLSAAIYIRPTMHTHTFSAPTTQCGTSAGLSILDFL